MVLRGSGICFPPFFQDRLTAIALMYDWIRFHTLELTANHIPPGAGLLLVNGWDEKIHAPER